MYISAFFWIRSLVFLHRLLVNSDDGPRYYGKQNDPGRTSSHKHAKRFLISVGVLEFLRYSVHSLIAASFIETVDILQNPKPSPLSFSASQSGKTNRSKTAMILFHVSAYQHIIFTSIHIVLGHCEAFCSSSSVLVILLCTTTLRGLRRADDTPH